MQPLKALKDVAARVRADVLAKSLAFFDPDVPPDKVHVPERLDGETMDQYRARRKRSRQLALAMTGKAKQPPAKDAMDYQRFFTGQRITPEGQQRMQLRKLRYQFDRTRSK